MSDLEHLISRYLDGDLSGAQLKELQQLLLESPDARATLREMTAVSRTAHRLASLHTPRKDVENDLFQKLRSEGLFSPSTSTPIARVDAPPAINDRSRRRRRIVVPMLIIAMLGIIGDAFIRRGAEAPTPSNIAEVSSGTPSIATPRQSTPAASQPTVSNSGTTRLPSTAPMHMAPSTTSARRTMTPTPRRIEPGRALDAVESPSSVPYAEITPVAPRESRGLAMVVSTTSDRAGEYLLPLPLPNDRASEPSRDEAREVVTTPASIAFRGDMLSSNEQAGKDWSVRIDAAIAPGHNVAVLGGRGSVQAHQNAWSQDYRGRAMVDGQPEPLATAPVQLTERVDSSEAWAGVGYSFTPVSIGPIDVSLGVSGGVGTKSLRAQADLSARCRVTSFLSVEAVGSYTRVTPHDKGMKALSKEIEGTYFSGEWEELTTNTPSFQLGIRVDL